MNDINEEIEAIAEMVESEEGFKVVYYDDPEKPQDSHVALDDTLQNIAAAIRARKRSL